MHLPQSWRDDFYARLQPVRRRLRARRALAAVERMAPAAVAIVLGLGAVQLAAAEPASWVVAVAGLAPLLGAAAWGWTRPVSWIAVARAVDARYDLEDRTLSALAGGQQFERDGFLAPIAEIQLADALERLAVVRSQEVVPLRLAVGRWLLLAGLALLLTGDAVFMEALRDHRADVARARRHLATPPPVAAPAPDANLPSELLTQPARAGWPVDADGLERAAAESHLGDNAATERYFEGMDRKSLTPESVR